MSTGVRRGWHPSAGWSLRTRLLLAMVGLSAALIAVTGVASVWELDRFLIGRLDNQLVAAVQRGELGADDDADHQTQGGTTSADQGDCSAQDTAGAAGAGGATGSGTGTSTQPGQGGGRGPTGLDVIGQGAGTVSVDVDNGQVCSAGIIADTAGGPRIEGITNPAVLAKLLAVPHDGRPHTVTLPTYGSYRVVDALTVSGVPNHYTLTGLPLDGVHHFSDSYPGQTGDCEKC